MPYIHHLSKDKKFKPLISEHGSFKLRKKKNVCLRLCAHIMSQQLNTKVAEVIFKRFLNLFDGNEPLPADILKIDTITLRSIGLSNAKVSYVHNVARFAVEKGMDEKKLSKMSNDEVIEYLTQIKGVGRWTVEMVLMFTLARPDVFAMDDLGIQNAMHKLYRIDKTDKKKMKAHMLRVSEKWSPFRTYACLHLWHFKDNGKK
ncbi:MAG TPA: DNA-3-methyladenine glycosylase 2 family protein [Bacteroidia bacterium]|nr:DNA-3-methyladenine glycosylase 2 family protein [Bacteroidia bacterium]